jgi:MFS superfamily sulfate permease-like transporter
MGISIACGMPVTSGLITGIVGGLIVATFAGSPLQVSGPAAGLVVVVFELVRQFGVPVVGIVVLAAGSCRSAGKSASGR